jgi:hypothetical protein
MAPAARASALARRVDPPGDRAGAGDEDDADPFRRARDEGDDGVVDDPHRAPDAEPPQQVAHEGAVGLAADAGDAEADGVDWARCVELVDDLVERLFDAELAVGAEIGAAGARRANLPAALVGQDAGRFGAAGVDSDDVAQGDSRSRP